MSPWADLGGQQSALAGVAAEDVGEPRGHHDPEAVVISAHTACSREDPVPKSGPATRTDPAAYRGCVEDELRVLRQAAKSPSSNPSGHPLEVLRRDDLVGVDVAAPQRDADAGVRL
jgi:hypothetical protein